MLLTLLFSCATDVPTTELTTQKPPFLKRYKHRTKELLYVVVARPRFLDDKTRDLIAENVKKFDPEIVVTMIPPEKPAEFTLDQNQCEVNEAACTPVAWACRFVKPRGIPCVTGDPFQTEIVKEAEARGLRPDEVLFYYVYASLLAEFPKNKDVLKKLPELIADTKDALNMVGPMNEEKFLYQYREKMGTKNLAMTKKNLAPVADGNYLQRLSKVIRDSTEHLILKKIRTEQLAHERVLVIYTLGHYRYHLAPLEKFFSTELP